jgi:hypothetical protein
LNISDIFNPQIIGYYYTPGFAQDVAVAGQNAFVADYYSFNIYNCSPALPVEKNSSEIPPYAFALSLVSPNPFNSQTSIKFSLEKPGLIKLIVYDVQGREVIKLKNESLAPGHYETTWFADKFSSGLYFIKLEQGKNSQTQKAILLK